MWKTLTSSLCAISMSTTPVRTRGLLSNFTPFSWSLKLYFYKSLDVSSFEPILSEVKNAHRFTAYEASVFTSVLSILGIVSIISQRTMIGCIKMTCLVSGILGFHCAPLLYLIFFDWAFSAMNVIRRKTTRNNEQQWESIDRQLLSLK